MPRRLIAIVAFFPKCFSTSDLDCSRMFIGFRNYTKKDLVAGSVAHSGELESARTNCAHHGRCFLAIVSGLLRWRNRQVVLQSNDPQPGDCTGEVTDPEVVVVRDRNLVLV